MSEDKKHNKVGTVLADADGSRVEGLNFNYNPPVSDFDSVEPHVSVKKDVKGVIGVGIAVAAVVGILTGIGFLSDSLRKPATDYKVSSSSASGQLLEVLDNSYNEASLSGVEEFYYDDTDTLVGVIVFDPSEGQEEAVIWEAVDNLYSTSPTAQASTIFGLALGSWHETADVSFGSSSGVYNAKFVGSQGEICFTLEAKNGLADSMATVDCSTWKLKEGAYSVDFSYGVSAEGKVLYNTAFGPLG